MFIYVKPLGFHLHAACQNINSFYSPCEGNLAVTRFIVVRMIREHVIGFMFAACTKERKRGTPRLLFGARCKPMYGHDSSNYVEILIWSLVDTGGF